MKTSSSNFKKKHRLTKSVVVLVILVIMVIVAYFTGIEILKKSFYPLKYFDIVTKEATKNNVDPYLVLSIIKTESSFKKDATSSKEAKGLMQIMESTASDINSQQSIVEEVNTINLYNEDINIALGTSYFASLVKKYSGNYYLAICAYNAGMGNVDKWIKDGIIQSDLKEYENIDVPFKETANYLNRVMSSYKMYKFLYR